MDTWDIGGVAIEARASPKFFHSCSTFSDSGCTKMHELASKISKKIPGGDTTETL